jgi:hypothetical protein
MLFGVPGLNVDLQTNPVLANLSITPPNATRSTALTGGNMVGILERVATANNIDIVVSDDPKKAQWEFRVAKANVQSTFDQIEDIIIACHYKVG